MDDLAKLRQEIDGADTQLIQLLAQRRELVLRVIRAKAKGGMPLRDANREEELLGELIAKGRGSQLDAHFVTRVFHEIIDDSVRLQQQYLLENANESRLRQVAYQGIGGAYSQLAARKFFAKDLEHTTFTGYSTFSEVIDAVEEGAADCAFLPVENTTAGSITEVYDLLSTANVFAIGEEIFRVNHCLLALEGAGIGDIRRVLSHPQALAQCRKFISNLPDADGEPYTDTAMAVRKVKDDNDPSQAAIASEEAGREYGLTVLKRHLADQRENYTRFLVVARQPMKVDERIPCKTSLVLATQHAEGALLQALSLLHQHQINLTKLESRPRPGMPFQYVFYLDFEGNRTSANVQKALAELRQVTTFLKILGSYPVEERGRTSPAQRSVVLEGAPPPSTPEPVSETHSRPAIKLSARANVVVFDDGPLPVIAGPAIVESEEQILRCAREVKEAGGQILSGGCFLSGVSGNRSPGRGPRQGLGLRGVELLAQARAEYDLLVLTEVVAAADVKAVAALVDIVHVGGRHMQDFDLLAELGKINCPVLLERATTATLEELLASAEYIAEQGNRQVILCEAGVRSVEGGSRITLDLAAVPLLRSRYWVIVNPTRAARDSEMVLDLARAARAVHAHGLLLELDSREKATPTQEGEALGEETQALDQGQFAALLREIHLQ